jgi:hypothetical protein
MKLNSEMVELLGIILGDGHLHTKQNSITIVGSLGDYNYYVNNVIPLFKKLFLSEPKLRRRNDRNSYYLTLTNKNVMNYLTQKMGLKRGKKLNPCVPKFIFNSKKFACCFLKGLFDTDGSIKFSKQARNLPYYPRIRISARESEMAKEIGILLKICGFNYGLSIDNRFGNNLHTYEISGMKNADRWFKLIKPNNSVHKTKYSVWKSQGYYLPMSLSERVKFINRL